jgi:uncharacterized membrane protein
VLDRTEDDLRKRGGVSKERTETTTHRRNPRRPPELHGGVHHPAVVRQSQQRAGDLQLRLADKITAFAGSMTFVYVHVFVFVVWMVVLENNPWPTLTLAVSLEAIFLSTFVLIGQNRQAAFQQAKADHDYENVNKMLEENTSITRAIHQLTQDVHAQVIDSSPTTK